MGCVLRITGARFSVDDVLRANGWTPVSMWRKGDVVGIGGKVRRSSCVKLAVSASADGTLQAQVRDALTFLEEHEQAIRAIVSTDGVESVDLDFGIAWSEETVTYTDVVPAELVRLAGRLGLGLELTHYQVSEP